MSGPYDFMTPGEPVRPRDHAEAAAEAIRALNHATIRRGDAAGYEWPSDVAAVIANLRLLTAYLPQALQQAQDWLLDQQSAGRVGHDDPHRKTEFAVGVVALSLNEAALRLRPVTDSLDRAHQESSHLTGVDDDLDEVDDVAAAHTAEETEGGEW